jgi:hypothetical protein
LAGIKKLLLLPFYAIQVFTGKKNFGANPILASESLNRRGLHVFRVRLAHRLAVYRRRKLTRLISQEDRADFERDGFVMKPEFLPADDFRRLCAEIVALQGEAREIKEGDAVTRRIPITPELLKQAPTLKLLIENPIWTGLTRYIGSFDVEPVVNILTVSAHAGTPGKRDPQTDLHMDTFHPTMKAWFFLHDVADEEGPFTYVPGSHIPTPRRLAWQRRRSILAARGMSSLGGAFRLPPSVLKRLHLPLPHRFAVPGNTLVVGDTYGFHARGESLRASTRVTIFASSRPSPFIPFVDLDPARIPFVSGRKEMLFWRWQDAMAKLGLARPKWRNVGVVAPHAEVAGRSAKAKSRRKK